MVLIVGSMIFVYVCKFIVVFDKCGGVFNINFFRLLINCVFFDVWGLGFFLVWIVFLLLCDLGFNLLLCFFFEMLDNGVFDNGWCFIFLLLLM